jgi:hypothetical protein
MYNMYVLQEKNYKMVYNIYPYLKDIKLTLQLILDSKLVSYSNIWNYYLKYN